MSLIPRNFYLDDIFDSIDRGTVKPAEMRCDVYEENGNYNVLMDIPGYNKKDIAIECNDGILTVTAEHSEENEKKDDKNYLRRERFYGKVSRSFTFGDIDDDNIKAEFNDGTLKITIPKKEISQTKKLIEID